MLAGSVAVASYGVELVPGDLDVVPEVTRENLTRIASLLEDLEAHPEALGHWEGGASGRRRWIDHGATDQELLAWRPDPAQVDSLDHLFRTALGNLDIVPELAGRYEDLLTDASPRELEGVPVNVVSAAHLLATMDTSNRAKDQPRIARLRELVGAAPPGD